MSLDHETVKHLRIIDALGPFIEQTDRDVINWSKVTFSNLEANGRIPLAVQRRIIARFERFATHVAALGYNALSIDDIAHLVSFPFYDPSLQTLLGDYQSLYTKLFAIAKKKRLQLFINTDYLFMNADIEAHLVNSSLAADDFFASVMNGAFDTFPQLDGIILRIGENDGKDVEGSFLSQLTIHTPTQANRLLRHILPIFEQRAKTLIFRTWTVGAYGIGDLIWNKKTFDTVFSSVDSDALIISMKYGDTDFMRYLSLNPLFFHSQHKKIIELQTRREWEGMGMFPSFIGWDYAAYLNQLVDSDNLIGIHVWCQTGGWAKKGWSNITYLENSSFWNELNTEVTVDISRGYSVETAIARFCKKRRIAPVSSFIELLRQSEIAVKKGIYTPDAAIHTLYFRRSRIPPLMWLTWDKVLINSFTLTLHRALLSKRQIDSAIRDGDEAAVAARRMVDVAQELKLKSRVIDSLTFEYATLVLFARLRRFIFGRVPRRMLPALNSLIDTYQKKYPQHYSISPLLPIGPHQRLPRPMLKLLLRSSSPYRAVDTALLRTSPIQARLIRYYLRRSRSHLADQSMGFEVLFK